MKELTPNESTNIKAIKTTETLPLEDETIDDLEVLDRVDLEDELEKAEYFYEL